MGKVYIVHDGSSDGGLILLLVTCVLILCVLSFSVPPLKEEILHSTNHYKTQHIFLGPTNSQVEEDD